MFNSDFRRWPLSFGKVPDSSISLSGVAWLEDFAAEMEEGCKQLHLAEGAVRKSSCQGTAVLSLSLLCQGKADQEFGFKGF